MLKIVGRLQSIESLVQRGGGRPRLDLLLQVLVALVEFLGKILKGHQFLDELRILHPLVILEFAQQALLSGVSASNTSLLVR